MNVPTHREQFLQEAATLYESLTALRQRTESFDEIEKKAMEAGKKLARELMKGRLHAEAAEAESKKSICPSCGHPMRMLRTGARRRLLTSWGRVTYKRAYGVCDRCGESFSPVDAALGIPDTGPSAGYLRRVSAANRAGSYPKASSLLWELAGIALPPKGVARISRKVGDALVHLREKDRERFLRGEKPESPPNPPDLLVISADGGRLQMRTKNPDQRWKENKVGVVYRAVPRPEQPGEDYEGPSPLVRTHVATMAEWDTMADYLSLEAARRGYDQALQKIVIGDAAQGIHSLWQCAFCDAEFILDWIHVVEHLHVCARAAFGSTGRSQDWYDHQKESLWQGKTHLVIRAIAKESKRLGKPRKNASEQDPRLLLARALGYFRNHQAHMDYPRYRRNGWPIGSGIIESSVKQLGKRVKGSEKHWSFNGVEPVLVLMTYLLAEDNRWDDFWKHHPFSSLPSQAA